MRYSEIEYPTDESGVGDYPQKLIDYLQFRFFRQSGSLLDVGCGNGYYVTAFKRRGIIAHGIDRDDCDLEMEFFPCVTNWYDYVFSKSTLEHVWNTENVLEESLRVLKPNGLAVFLVPDWNAQKDIFYDDPTHLRPFTQKSLAMSFKLAGFRNVSCEKFCTLAFSWEYPLLAKFLIPLARLIPGKPNKFVRFAKETMLLCYGVK